jgi:hypothetical protein
LVTESGRESVSIPLEPDLEVVDVQPVDDPQSPMDYGKLVVTVANRGTGPSWVHSVAYEDAPNFVANTSLGDNPGVFVMSGVDEPTDVVVPSGGINEFASGKTPLAFPDTSKESCDSTQYRLTVKIATATAETLRRDLVVTAQGTSDYVRVQDHHVCSEVSVRLVSGE